MTEIIVGREEHSDAPRLALNIGGNLSFMGKPGCVNKHMSRKHCRIVLEDDGSISVYDITADNYIMVNGKECKQKRHLTISDTVELGSDRYPLDLSAIVTMASSSKEFSITHLEKVYDDYQKQKMDFQVRQGKIGALGMLPTAISMISGCVALFVESIRIPMLVVAAFFLVCIFVVRFLGAEANPQKQKQMEEHFHDHYVCPNPACHQFLGAKSYKDLKHMKACPYCKAKWTIK